MRSSFIGAIIGTLWATMRATGKGYMHEGFGKGKCRLRVPGKRNPAGSKIEREAAAGMITKRNGRRL